MTPLWAVHIADGQLTSQVCLMGWLISVALLFLTLAKTDELSIPKIAMLAGVFFLGSLLHVPGIFGTRTHLLLTGLVGIMLGTQAITAIACGLSLQAILFSHGGISSFGINLLVMGIPAILAGMVFKISAKRINPSLPEINTQHKLRFLAFISGSGSVLLVIAFYSVALWIGATADWRPQILLNAGVHIPLAIIEGLLCAGVIDFQYRLKTGLYETKNAQSELIINKIEPKLVIQSQGLEDLKALPPNGPDQH